MNLNGEEYFYIRNAQGDIIGLFDKNGVEVASYSYDVFGKLTPSKAEIDDANDTDKNGITGSLASTVGIKNPYLYRGYRFDSDTGLYYLQSRYYNPSWGRFLNADAIIGSAGELLGNNVFAYCKNNFVNGKDPSGFRSVPVTAGDDWEYKEPDIISKAYHKCYKTVIYDESNIANITASAGVTGIEGSAEAHTPYLGTSNLSTKYNISKYAALDFQGYIGGATQLGLSIVDDGEGANFSLGASLTPINAGMRGKAKIWIFNVELQGGVNYGIGGSGSLGIIASDNKLGTSASGLIALGFGIEGDIKIWIEF